MGVFKFLYPGRNVCAGAKDSQQDVHVSMVNVLLAIILKDLASLYLQNGDAQLTPNGGKVRLTVQTQNPLAH